MKRPLAFVLLLGSAALAAQQVAEHRVSPSADPGVTRFTENNVALYPAGAAPDAPLVVFMPGTDGRPENALGLLRVVAGQGYPVLGLEYDDAPAVAQLCPRDPDPDCAAKFREARVNGIGRDGPVTNPPAEGIVARLVTALHALDAAAPREGWGRYLDGDRPRWDAIVVSGLSQGAGMAAFIAKQHRVRRVVLFSSPWDSTGRDGHPAPWLSRLSATPPDRWFTEYHAREKTVGLLKAAYAALAIPPANIRVFDLDLPLGVSPANPNPYHAITIRDPRYADQWRAMFGRADDPTR